MRKVIGNTTHCTHTITSGKWRKEHESNRYDAVWKRKAKREKKSEKTCGSAIQKLIHKPSIITSGVCINYDTLVQPSQCFTAI